MSTVAQLTIDSTRLGAVVSRGRRADAVASAAGLLVLFVATATLLSLFVTLLSDGWTRLADPSFYTSFPSRRASSAGILSAWVGSACVMLVTASLAVPLGVGAGIYLEEYAPKNWVTDVIEINVTNLAGVPSIIYGLLALGLFVYGLGLGQVIAVAGMVLALLILPVVIVATRESIRAIPRELREAAYALGTDRWQAVRMFVLPAARPGILTGTIVGLGRAIGESAPVITIGALTFIAFLPPSPIQSEPPFVSFDWLWSPFTVLPIQMFNWVSRPQAAFQLNAAAAGVVLLVMTLLMNGAAIYLRFRLRKQLA
jgi:phosphate transport system permease protein